MFALTERRSRTVQRTIQERGVGGSSNAHETPDIFPLRLTPTEVWLLVADFASHPMEFFLRLRFTGRIERGALETALAAALARHPLLTAVVEQIGKCKWQWVRSDKLPEIDWRCGKLNDSLPLADRIDIYQRPGLRLIVVQDEQRADLVLQFQHTACDGLAASDFADDLLTAYADATNATRRGRLNRIDPTQLKARGDFGLSRWQSAMWLLRHVVQARRFVRFYKCQSLRVVPHRLFSHKSPRDRYPECFFHRFSRQESIHIQGLASKRGTTLNNLLLRDLFFVVADWCRENHTLHDNEIVRIALPISMRTAAQRILPAANVVSLVCLDRQLSELADEELLLKGIDDEMEAIRTQQRGVFLPLALRLLQRWPSLLARKHRNKRFAGTVLFSNIGPALAKCHLPRNDGKFAVGNLTLDEVGFLPVLRPAHAFTLGLSTYAGEVNLGVHHDSRLISAATAREICDRLVHRVQRSVT